MNRNEKFINRFTATVIIAIMAMMPLVTITSAYSPYTDNHAGFCDNGTVCLKTQNYASYPAAAASCPNCLQCSSAGCNTCSTCNQCKTCNQCNTCGTCGTYNGCNSCNTYNSGSSYNQYGTCNTCNSCSAYNSGSPCSTCATCNNCAQNYPSYPSYPRVPSNPSVPGTNTPAASGIAIGVYKNVTAYSNGGNSYGPWQCTEYAARFYKTVFGMDTSRWYGNAVDWYENGPTWGLKAYPNGGTIEPQPDDILVYGGGQYGHVAIITAVHTDSVEIIEQNADPNTAYRTVKKTGNTFSNEGTYYVKGWLRK